MALLEAVTPVETDEKSDARLLQNLKDYTSMAFALIWQRQAIYMAATLTSAAVLTQAGRLADYWRARSVALAVIAAFALVCVGVSLMQSWWMLPLLIFGQSSSISSNRNHTCFCPLKLTRLRPPIGLRRR